MDRFAMWNGSLRKTIMIVFAGGQPILLAALLSGVMPDVAVAQLGSLLGSYVPPSASANPSASPSSGYQPSPPPYPAYRMADANPPLPSAAGRSAASPSFNCARATAAAEIEICHEAALAALDRDIAAAFSRARAEAGSGGAIGLTQQQRAWIKQRDICGTNSVCLHRSMTERLAALQQIMPPGNSAGAAPATASLAQAPDATALAARSAAAAAGADPLERLAHPPPGLRAWPFETWDGQLALGNVRRRPAANADRTTYEISLAFFNLLALGMMPERLDRKSDYLDQPGNLAPISWFLSDDADKAVLAGGNGWAGANEFERAHARDKFFTTYAPLLRDVAPKPPFTLRWIETVRFGQYDAARGGFPLQTFSLPAFGDSRPTFELPSVIRSAGLIADNGLPLPDLFWPTGAAEAEAALRHLPERQGELGATVAVTSADPASRVVTLTLRHLSLYTPNRAAKLYDFPIAPEGAGSQRQAEASRSTVAAADPAAANGRDAVQRFGLRSSAGLPLLELAADNLTMENLRGAYFRDYTQSQKAGLTRAFSTLAIAATPAVLPGLGDVAVSAIACTLLDPRRQAELFGSDCSRRPASQGISPRAGQEFALRDAVAAFRRSDLPALVGAAPHLPLEVLVQVPVRLDPWDARRGAFHVAFPIQPVSLLDSPLPMAVPSSWPASEAEARAFVQAAPSRQGQYQYAAVLSVPVTITGATAGVSAPGQVGGFVSERTGLLGGGRWDLAVGDATLYADEAQTRVLHRYGHSLAYPVPIEGTPAAQAPRPAGPVPLSQDTALVILQRPGSAKLVSALDWQQAAQERLAKESYLRQNPGWREIDPWGVYFERGRDPMTVSAGPSDAEVAGYKAWTLKRAEALPDSIVIRQNVPASTGPRAIMVFDRQTGSSWIGDRPQSYPRALQAQSISDAQVLPVQLNVPGGRNVITALLAVPKPWNSYVLEAANGVPPPPQSGRADPDMPSLEVRVGIAGTEELASDPNAGGRRTILIRLNPISATVRSGDATVASVSFPQVDWPSAPPPAAPATAAVGATAMAAAAPRPTPQPPPDPEQRLAAGPYGPDMLGIHIGTPMPEAESLIRAHMHVVRVLKTAPPLPGTPAEPSGELFVANDRPSSYFSEEIAIYEAPPPRSGKVVAAWRTLYVDAGSWDDILRGLTSKYGPPSRDLSAPRQPAWGSGTKALCRAGGAEWHQRWTEDGQPLSRLPNAAVQPVEVPVPTGGAQSRTDACGPLVAADYQGPESMADAKPLYRFTTTLLDPALLAH